MGMKSTPPVCHCTLPYRIRSEKKEQEKTSNNVNLWQIMKGMSIPIKIETFQTWATNCTGVWDGWGRGLNKSGGNLEKKFFSLFFLFITLSNTLSSSKLLNHMQKKSTVSTFVKPCLIRTRAAELGIFFVSLCLCSWMLCQNFQMLVQSWKMFVLVYDKW